MLVIVNFLWFQEQELHRGTTKRNSLSLPWRHSKFEKFAYPGLSVFDHHDYLTLTFRLVGSRLTHRHSSERVETCRVNWRACVKHALVRENMSVGVTRCCVLEFLTVSSSDGAILSFPSLKPEVVPIQSSFFSHCWITKNVLKWHFSTYEEADIPRLRDWNI